MSYNGSGTFVINSTGQPVVTGTVISSSTFNSLTADLGTGLSTAITKDGQTTTTALIPFAAGVSSTLATDATSISTGSLLTSGGLGVTKAAWIGGLMNVAGAATFQSSVSISGVVTFTGLTFTLDLKSNTAFATPAALSATGYRAFASTVSGAAMMGFGTTNDVSLMNRAGTVVLGVGPNTTLVNIPAALTVGTTLGVTGATTLSSTLGVTGATTLSSTLGVSGQATIGAGAVKLYSYSDASYSGISNTSNATSEFILLDPLHNIYFGVTNSTRMTLTTTGINSTAIGATTPSTGAFTTLGVTGQANFVTSAGSPNMTIGNTGAGDTGFLLTMLATTAKKNWQHSFNSYSAGYSIHYSTVNGGSTFNSSNVAINFGETGAVTIPGTLGVTGLITASGGVTVASGQLLSCTSTSNANAATFSSTGVCQIWLADTNAASNDKYGGLQMADGTINLGFANDDRASGFATPVFLTRTALTVNAANLNVTASGTLYNLVDLKDTVDQSGATYVQFRNSAGGGTGSITRVTTTNAVTYNTTSDYRLKNNQAPLMGSGEFIDALKPKTWEWAENGIKAAGFIAHEFAEVSPSSVSGEKDGTEEEEYEVSPAVDATFDEDGKELTPAVAAVKATRTVPLYQGMQASSSEVIANMVAELQSLRSRVALLEAK